MTAMLRIALVLCMTAVVLATGATMAAGEPEVHTVFLDPGHGGIDSGAIHRNARGAVDLQEKNVNLAVALKTAELLRARGYRVILSREKNLRPGRDKDVNGDGRITHRDGLQAAVDAANESGADIFISMHSNANRDPNTKGVEVYYCAEREFADESRRLAGLVKDNLLKASKNIDYTATDRGVKDDSVLFPWARGRAHLFVLGPIRQSGWGWGWSRRSVHPRATKMPGALGEGLFLSNDVEARILASPEGQLALARGYAAAVEAYFESGEDDNP